ncbi:MAG: DUF2161 family putative PD-(D/E)XK-type phosphodiesterase [Pseudomonadota bacterium]
MRETDLYGPVKAYLEGQGYEVKSEIQSCDVVARRGSEPPVVVELKLSLSLNLLMQGVDRQAITDAVYLAVPATKGRSWGSQLRTAVKLCRRLGLGLLTIRGNSVIAEVDPGPYAPRKMPKRREALLREFDRRVGDPNTGGQTRRKIVTAYRQDALRLAIMARASGDIRPKEARAAGVEKAASILQKDHYGWFEREDRGVYSLRPAGIAALDTYADVVASLTIAEAAE